MRPVKHHPWSEEDYTSRSWVMGIIQVLEASYFYGRDSWYRVDYPSSPSNRKTIPLFERFVGLWIVCETIRVTNPPFMNYETGKSMLKSHSNNNNNNVWDENGNNFEFLSFFLEIIIRAMLRRDDSMILLVLDTVSLCFSRYSYLDLHPCCQVEYLIKRAEQVSAIRHAL